MLIVRCQNCNKELRSHPSQSHSCGCANMMTVVDDRVTAVDLNRVIMIRSNEEKETRGLSSQDLAWQEQRRKRKVRKLDFEVR